MNRPQLPAEVKSFVCERVASGQWTLEAAEAATSFTAKTIKRWLKRHRKGGAADGRVSRRGRKQRKKTLNAGVRRLVDDLLLRLPHLRTRSVQDYLRRHHQVKVPRGALSRYLASRGFVDPPNRKTKEPEPRRFEAPAPLDLVQVDIMWVGRPEERLYVVNTLDDHSRFLLGSQVLTTQTGAAVLAVFGEVVNRWGVPRAVLTDRGTQFAHWNGRTRFQDYVEKELKAKHILAARQHPQTLGKLERYHATLRKEKLIQRKEGYPTVDALQADLDDYIDYYNYERPHQALGGLTPADRFFSMGDPTARALEQSTDDRIFLTANLLGRRLVLAGRDPRTLRVLWQDGSPQSPHDNGVPPKTRLIW